MGGPAKPKSRTANLFISLSTFFFSLQWIQLMQSRILHMSPTFTTFVDASAIAKFWREMAPLAKISPSPSIWIYARTSKVKSSAEQKFHHTIPLHLKNFIIREWGKMEHYHWFLQQPKYYHFTTCLLHAAKHNGRKLLLYFDVTFTTPLMRTRLDASVVMKFWGEMIIASKISPSPLFRCMQGQAMWSFQLPKISSYHSNLTKKSHHKEWGEMKLYHYFLQ